MAPPSKLAVATSSVVRLVKEEASYHKELEQQQARIKKLEGSTGDENAEYQLKQERQALEETKNVLPALRQKIKDALAKLEDELEANKDVGGDAATDEVTKAKETVASAKTAIRESA
ncbi:putative tubulin-specific chaperone rbl2 protein [Neofusicoccum parvum]|uniref:Tubulin-specific chaperone A n=2 Tax=Neofusicoccum parvum TaxID=310453 RepID=R1GL09_BOTPV|nr:putative tubulin-specific chaperone rbl2 protein [Neofusicoccum parvum UCRNP2]GME24297.1 putative tubulin-specific chaperone rbl2 protein [Neofusicoccum parvum]GME41057.1 putative tubulin-specific chaperone rbl2 protein [Neofusicoccum parvum]